MQGRNMKKKKVDVGLAEAQELLRAISENRPMSRLHPRFQIFREALDELVQKGEILESEIAYVTFCYAEQ